MREVAEVTMVCVFILQYVLILCIIPVTFVYPLRFAFVTYLPWQCFSGADQITADPSVFHNRSSAQRINLDLLG